MPTIAELLEDLDHRELSELINKYRTIDRLITKFLQNSDWLWVTTQAGLTNESILSIESGKILSALENEEKRRIRKAFPDVKSGDRIRYKYHGYWRRPVKVDRFAFAERGPYMLVFDGGLSPTAVYGDYEVLDKE